MDVLEILVLLIALVLIALVVAVVLVSVQALTSRKSSSSSETESGPAVTVPASGGATPTPVTVPVAMPVAREDEILDEDAEMDGQSVEDLVFPGDNPESTKTTGKEVPVTPQAHYTPNSDAPSKEQPGAASQDRRPPPAYQPVRDNIPEDRIRRPIEEVNVATPVRRNDENFPYVAGGPLLTPLERLFYGDLKTSVSDKTEIFCKVRASDILNPRSDLNFEESHFAAEQLATQRFDFVLCDSRDFSVIGVIELDGMNEREGLRKAQREVLRKSAESANLPVLLVDMKRGYTIKEIRDRVNYLLPKESGGYMEGSLSHQTAELDALFDEQDEGISQYRQVDSDDDVEEATLAEADEVVVKKKDVAAVAVAKDSVAETHEDVDKSAATSGAAEVVDKKATPASEHKNACPRCQSPLKLSLATTGEFAGQYFWICTKLPECPYVAPIAPPQ
ncbi:DUF2726 domain-containing protein [Oceanobacter antarcticus]|jgi:hypothetical protein|uniref:DUF2726 domain-containing protein n=1 Tax=Oceanobacter antarcticus TaxID=3133425 RepID=A0ABW8NDU9_9GAMM